MSAFIVREETLHRAVGALLWWAQHKGGISDIFGIKRSTKRAADRIGTILQVLNHEAYLQRYDYEEAEALPSYQYIDPKTSPVDMYKGLVCLKYQCTEGDVPECAIFKEMEKLCYEISSEFDHDSADYRLSSWD